MKQFVQYPERSEAEKEVLRAESAIDEMSKEIKDIDNKLVKIRTRQDNLNILREKVQTCTAAMEICSTKNNKGESMDASLILQTSWWQLARLATKTQERAKTQ